jgi:hypothetical protein
MCFYRHHQTRSGHFRNRSPWPCRVPGLRPRIPWRQHTPWPCKRGPGDKRPFPTGTSAPKRVPMHLPGQSSKVRYLVARFDCGRFTRPFHSRSFAAGECVIQGGYRSSYSVRVGRGDHQAGEVPIRLVIGVDGSADSDPTQVHMVRHELLMYVESYRSHSGDVTLCSCQPGSWRGLFRSLATADASAQWANFWCSW